MATPGAVPVVLNQHGVGDTAIGAILGVAGDTVIRPVEGRSSRYSHQNRTLGFCDHDATCACCGAPSRIAVTDVTSPTT